MSFRLIIQDKAILEIKDAFEWYEKQNEGLGFEFINEIESCYLSLSKHLNAILISIIYIAG